MHMRLAGGFTEGRKYGSEEEACLAIQSFFRKVRDVKRYRDKIRTVFSKHYDEEQFLFFFVNTITGTSQWHRPAGLGGSAENDLPETDFVSQADVEIWSEEKANGAAMVVAPPPEEKEGPS